MQTPPEVKLAFGCMALLAVAVFGNPVAAILAGIYFWLVNPPGGGPGSALPA